jgi:signal transduction histidine kinase
MAAMAPLASTRNELRAATNRTDISSLGPPLDWAVGEAAQSAPAPSIDDVLAEIAHDLCTPVAAIRTTVELLLERLESFDQVEGKRLLSCLRHDARWLEDLLTDLSEGRVAAGVGEDFRGAPFDLRECVKRVVPIVQPLVDNRCQRVEVDVPSRRVPVWGDEHLIRRVVINLLNNAAKYSHASDIIHVAVKLEANWAFVEVRDHGPGVSQISHVDLFRRRARSTSTAERRGPNGRGLGLSIVKSLVEWHAGKVGVRNEGGNGAAFWFALPRLGSRRSNALAASTFR